VDERSSPKVLRVVLVKDVPNEDWPLESQPLPPQSRPVAAALSSGEQPRFGWVFRAHK
jgi:hypothetical protein